MKIEHIVYLSPEEFHQFVSECKAHNSNELKKYLKEKLNFETDFRLYVEEDTFRVPIGDY